jgi:tRNA threonylcarbamoyladenosine biosynthesis protein TsaB
MAERTMKILAIDTATERCSVALSSDGVIVERSTDTPRGHADLVLPMIQSVLAEAGMTLAQIDGIAYGRGPGGFTGVRIAIGVVQGLAFGAGLPTVGVSNLAAVAQQVATPGDRVLVCMDARMGEVYWGVFHCNGMSGLVEAASEEAVAKPELVVAAMSSQPYDVTAGTGWQAYPQLASLAVPRSFPSLLPRASDIAKLAEREFVSRRGLPAAAAQPVYLRNQVVSVKAGKGPAQDAIRGIQ